MLNIYSFVVGFVVLSLEIIALRQMQFEVAANSKVTGIVIGLILAALTVGNYLGGKLCSKKDAIKKYHKSLIYVSIYVFFTQVFFVELFFHSVFFQDIKGVSLQASVFILIFYFYPSVVLGQNLPIYLNEEKERNLDFGRGSALLLAASSLGAILGTIFTSQFLLQLIGQKATILLISFILCALGLFGYLISKKKIIVFSLLPFFLFSYYLSDKIYREENLHKVLETSYGTLKIYKGEDWVSFKTSKTTDSFIDLKNDFSNQWSLSMLSPALSDYVDKVLILGLSGGSHALQLKRIKPLMKIDGVEIDEAVSRVSNELLSGKLFDIVEPIFEDARFYLKRNKDKYDFIIMDIFKSNHIPEHCVTKTFFDLINSSLSEYGVLVINTNLKDNFFQSEGDNDLLIRRLEKTIFSSGFEDIYYNVYTNHLFAFRKRVTALKLFDDLENVINDKLVPQEIKSISIVNLLGLVRIRDEYLKADIFVDDKSFELFSLFDNSYTTEMNSVKKDIRSVSSRYAKIDKFSKSEYEKYTEEIESVEDFTALKKYLLLDKRNRYEAVDSKLSTFLRVYSNVFYHFRRKEFNLLEDAYKQLKMNAPFDLAIM